MLCAMMRWRAMRSMPRYDAAFSLRDAYAARTILILIRLRYYAIYAAAPYLLITLSLMLL